ncbi:MAG: hypothetical protein RH942_19630 [Kiloniellaceae bacterium]
MRSNIYGGPPRRAAAAAKQKLNVDGNELESFHGHKHATGAIHERRYLASSRKQKIRRPFSIYLFVVLYGKEIF